TYELDSNVSENNQRFESLTIDCEIRQEALYCSMTYDNNKYEEIVISRLKYEFMDALSKVVNHCLSRNDRTLTVSDFEFDEDLSQDELNEIDNLLK
ncbi:condensation domain-containing protein, partial [Streptococcus intermedius]